MTVTCISTFDFGRRIFRWGFCEQGQQRNGIRRPLVQLKQERQHRLFSHDSTRLKERVTPFPPFTCCLRQIHVAPDIRFLQRRTTLLDPLQHRQPDPVKTGYFLFSHYPFSNHFIASSISFKRVVLGCGLLDLTQACSGGVTLLDQPIVFLQRGKHVDGIQSSLIISTWPPTLHSSTHLVTYPSSLLRCATFDRKSVKISSSASELKRYARTRVL